MIRFARPVAAVFVIILGGLFCGDAGALTPAQCSYFATQDRVAICHQSAAPRQPYVLLYVSQQSCAAGHAGHPRDFVAFGDVTCNGSGALPEGAPCDDASVECGDGLSCVANICSKGAPPPIK